MADQIKNLLLGIFCVVVGVLIIWMILFIKPVVGNEEQILYVRFSDVNMIGVGTRVTMEGHPVGEITAIYPIPNARSKPIADPLGRLYYYQATVKVDSSVQLYDTDEVAIETSGLLGEKTIAFYPKAAPANQTPKLVTSQQPVYANSVSTFDLAFKELTNLAESMQGTFNEATSWIQNNGDELGRAVTEFSDTMHEAHITLSNFNSLNILTDVKSAVVTFNQTIDNIQDIICQMRDDGTFTNASEMMANLKNASASIADVTADIADGRGTLGQLITNDDLYLRFKGLVSKVDILMNDINHYGLFFYQNKSWQRLRTQRMAAITALDSPESFKNYFEGEVDQIQTSMARLSQLIEKARGPQQKQVLQNNAFRKDFAELLDKVDELSRNLKMYNVELMHLEEAKCK